MGTTFGGRPCIEPAHLIRQCREQQIPVGEWAEQANSYCCPLGSMPGTGSLLMLRRDVAGLVSASNATDNHSYQLTMADGRTLLRFGGLYIVSAECVTPSGPSAPDSAYHVRIADSRWLWSRFMLNAAYNLPLTPTSVYSTFTAPALQTPYTWSQVWSAIWAPVGGTAPSLPYTPHAWPEGLDYYGKNAQEAIGDFVLRLGCGLVYNPFTGAFSLARLGDADPTFAAQVRAVLGMRLHDLEPIRPTFHVVAGKVQVFFPAQPTPAYGANHWKVIEVTDGSPVAGESTTHVARIFDDLPAKYAANTLVNQTDLNTRAAERAARYWAIAKQWAEGCKVYSGVHAFVPGSLLGRVIWRDGADGVTTTIESPEPETMERWPGVPDQPWRLVEVVRLLSATPDANKMVRAQVDILDLTTNTFVASFDSLARFANL